jgi:general secretion pathway protein N
MRTNAARWLAFAAFLAAALIVLMPMRLALGWLGLARAGLTARDAHGTVWSGGLDEAALGPVPIGDVRARLGALPLLFGHARVALSRSDPDPLAGTIDVSRHGFGVRRATGRIAAGALLAPAPVASIDLADVSAEFADGRCISASGQISATLAGPLAAVMPGLTGQATCENEAVLIPLAGGGGRIDLRLGANGRYRLDARVTGANEAVAGALQGAGFSPVPGGYALHRDGAL